jgi:Holliday junction resolvase
MANTAKRKGDTFERDVVAYLREQGFPYVERAYGAGRPDDIGDIDGIPGWCIECKDHKTLRLAEWVDEVRREQAQAGAEFGVVVAKRRQRPIGQAYVVMELEQLVRLLKERDALEV